MATLGNYYYDGTSFGFATVLCTDVGLLNPAPDGWYSQAGIYRQMAGGILGGLQTCMSCIYECDDPAVSDNAAAFGQYTLTVDLGTALGAVLAEFTVGANTVARCTWTYDGLTASEYSSPNYGYCEGAIGDENCCGVDNATGSAGATYTGTAFGYGASGWANQGVQTWGPYADQASGGVGLTPGGGYGTCIMVVPKPNATPNTATFVVDMPNLGSNSFSLKVNCPETLPMIEGDFLPSVDCATACAVFDPAVYRQAVVSGTTGVLAVNDWIFTGGAGGTHIVDGIWKFVISGVNHCITTANGVVTSITAC